MKFSIQIPTCTEGLVNPVPFAAPDDFIRMAQEAERLGYDAVWGNDHINPASYARQKWPEPPNFYEVLVTLATVGAHTTRIRLGTAVLVVPLRDPVLLAKQISTLDRFTNGRVILGTGIGAYREEFDAQWPRRKAERRGDLLDESLAALQCLFRDTDASYEGRHIAFKNIAMRPKPLQDPLPIFVGGHNEAMIRRAARLGQGWLPGWRPFDQIVERVALLRRLTEEAGRHPRDVEACSQFTLCIGKTVEEARPATATPAWSSTGCPWRTPAGIRPWPRPTTSSAARPASSNRWRSWTRPASTTYARCSSPRTRERRCWSRSNGWPRRS